jgi:hypothetical protein
MEGTVARTGLLGAALLTIFSYNFLEKELSLSWDYFYFSELYQLNSVFVKVVLP